VRRTEKHDRVNAEVEVPPTLTAVALHDEEWSVEISMNMSLVKVHSVSKKCPKFDWLYYSFNTHQPIFIFFRTCHRRRFCHAILRLRSAIRRHHPPQRAVLRQICCFWERKVVLFQILLDGAEPRDAGTT